MAKILSEKKKMVGVTLIETILYLGIAVLVLGAIFSYGWNIIGTSVKASVVRETLASAEIFRERLMREIKNAQSVDRGNSAFGSAPGKLALQVDGGSVTIEDLGGEIVLKRGTNDPVSINFENVRINNLIFTEQISAEDETEYVGFSFDAAASYAGSEKRSEYQFSVPFRSGAALRNH